MLGSQGFLLEIERLLFAQKEASELPVLTSDVRMYREHSGPAVSAYIANEDEMLWTPRIAAVTAGMVTRMTSSG